ncbi:hypothetical protein BKI52_40905 [marine bacterium AO1-C]|nr:hypothetical protein BKI52_40905 [marine bacterium AO1-C]
MKHLFFLLILGSLWSCQESTHQKQSNTSANKQPQRKPIVNKEPPSSIPTKKVTHQLNIPYDASAGQKRALLAEEAYQNPQDTRTYGGDPKAKARGEKLDCSYFIREVEATFQSEEARKIKQQKGYLAPHELVKYNPFFTNKRLYANKLSSLSGKMADVLQKHGFYSTKVSDVRLGDYVFIGKGKVRDLKSISHVMVINRVDTVGKQIRYYFIDAGYRGLKKVNGKLVKVKRSVRKGYYLTDKGTVWSKKYIRYFKGTGRPR